jgi:hypothetical protein
MSNENSEKKCIAVHLPIDLLAKINDFKAKTGKSQSGLLGNITKKSSKLHL